MFFKCTWDVCKFPIPAHFLNYFIKVSNSDYNCDNPKNGLLSSGFAH